MDEWAGLIVELVVTSRVVEKPHEKFLSRMKSFVTLTVVMVTTWRGRCGGAFHVQ